MGDNLPAVDLGTNSPQLLQVTAGSNFTCALVDETSTKKVKCWGSNSSLQLGRSTPSVVGTSPSHMGNYLVMVLGF
jgi:hypothetical protein